MPVPLIIRQRWTTTLLRRDIASYPAQLTVFHDHAPKGKLRWVATPTKTTKTFINPHDTTKETS
jgi:hypothetical protein